MKVATKRMKGALIRSNKFINVGKIDMGLSMVIGK
jgi:hypothetical protein